MNQHIKSALKVLIVIVGLVIVWMLLSDDASKPVDSTNPEQEVSEYESKSDYESDIIAAVEKASPAVVAITVSKNVPIIENCPYSPFGSDLFGGFQFSVPCQKGTEFKDIGGGSGFIVSADGMILTNKHVVSDKEASYTVFTNDGKKHEANVLAVDPVQDLAVIKIDGKDFPVLELGNSDSLKLGQTAISIGNALAEFRNTVSVGVVSGLSRTITAGDRSTGDSEVLEGVIQTDAAINPGNSGGPLINLRGEVIGINTAVVSGAQSIGFAIPINKAKRDIESVKKTGKILTPYLGIHYLLITPELAEKEELPVTEGALIRGGTDGPAVLRNSPAAKAGIQAEDIITEVNGTKITLERSLASIIQNYQVGETVTLKILRGSSTISVSVTLEERQ